MNILNCPQDELVTIAIELLHKLTRKDAERLIALAKTPSKKTTATFVHLDKGENYAKKGYLLNLSRRTAEQSNKQ